MLPNSAEPVQNQYGGHPGRAYERITAALQAHNLRGQYRDNKTQAQCPAHQDRNPSLTVTRTDNKTLIHCHSGCQTPDILAALGLHTSDLFDYDRMQWDYTNPNTGEVYRTVSRNGDKQYRQTVNDPQPRLYNLERIRKAREQGEPVYLVEGEKDADTLGWLGHAATTAPMGAANFNKVDATPLTGLNITAIVDNDEAGKGWAEQVQETVSPIAASLSFKTARIGKDITDHVAAGLTVADCEDYDPKAEQHEQVRLLLPNLNWHDLWNKEEEEEWLLFPLIPARRLIALFSPAKAGKSLLMLEIAAALSAGKKVLNRQLEHRLRVLYIDFENDPRSDIKTRLQDMGYGPDDLDHLDYLSFPNLGYLDSPAGASTLLAAIEAYGSQLIVIDTISRAVQGEENDNDTWLNLYKHTGLALKQAKVAMIRLDHTGKDETKGQRGGSAKTGDVDAIWKLTTTGVERFRLECISSRFPLEQKEVTLLRRDDPLRHDVEDTSKQDEAEDIIQGLIEEADRDGEPDDIGRDKLRAWAKTRSIKVSNYVLSEVVRRRKHRPQAFDFRPSKPVPDSSKSNTVPNEDGTEHGT